MSNDAPRPKRKSGCLWLLAFLALVYFGNAARLLIPNAINRLKWESHSITHYQALVGDPEFPAKYWIEVKNGRLIKDNGRDVSDAVVTSGHLLETNFDISDCVWWFPLLVCNYRYNARFGYPEYVSQSMCHIRPRHCKAAFEVFFFSRLK